MKKHIFGFALFSLIVASFVFIYAFFRAPSIPTKEAVLPPVTISETRSERPVYCPSRTKKLSYEVLGSEFDINNNKLRSKIRLPYNGRDMEFKQIFATAKLFTLDQKELPMTLKTVSIMKLDYKADETTLIIFSELDKNKKINEGQNLYVTFKISEDNIPESYADSTKNLTEAHEVLLVHGEKSVAIY